MNSSTLDLTFKILEFKFFSQVLLENATSAAFLLLAVFIPLLSMSDATKIGVVCIPFLMNYLLERVAHD